MFVNSLYFVKVMGKKIGTILQYIIFLGGGIFLIWWQFHKMSPDQIAKFKFSLASANYWLMIPVVICALASHVSRSVRWRILMAPMGYRPLLFNTFGVTMVGYLANSFVPRLGEILKCTLLGKYENIPVQKLIGTVVIERIFDFSCYLIFIIITILTQYQLVGNFVASEWTVLTTENTGTPFWLRGIFFIVVVVITILLLRFIFKSYGQGKFIKPINHFIKGIKEGIATIKNLRQRGWFLFHTFFIWSMYLLQIFIGFSAIPEVAHLGLNAACSVLTLATLAMIITPGGIGTFPTAVFLVLGLYKIDQSTGEAFGWLMWGATTFIVLFFGLLLLGLLVIFNNNKSVLLSNKHVPIL